MIKQIGHLCFYTNQANAMVRFYCEILGFEIAFTFDDDEGEPFGWYLHCGNMTFVEIFDQQGAIAKWGGNTQTWGPESRYQHVCFEVDSLEQMLETLGAKGLQTKEIIVGLDNSKQSWIKDPDGNSIELMEYTSKSLELAVFH